MLSFALDLFESRSLFCQSTHHIKKLCHSIDATNCLWTTAPPRVVVHPPVYDTLVISSDRSSYSDDGLLYIYVMIFLPKPGLCIKVTFMHNSCWFNYYDKCYLC